MKLTFLGTGAADWNIDDYDEYVKNGDEGEFRRCCSALVNDDLLIDPGPHIFHFAEHKGTPDMFDNVKNIIVTHTHGDHFNSQTVEKLCLDRDCALWGDMACLKKLIRELGAEKASKIKFYETTVRRSFAYHIGNYDIWSLRSNHDSGDASETTRLYLINDGERILYYGCDSSWIPTESWNVIKNYDVNAMVLEDTCGELAPNDWRIFEHNTIEMLEIMIGMFRKYNCFADDVKFYTSHMARTLHTSHDELTKRLAQLGVTPAFDGMVIDV